MLNFPSFFNAQVGGYEIEQSLRFDGSSYLSRTPSAAGTLGTWTISYWAKRGKSGFNSIFNSGSVNQQGIIYMTDSSDVFAVLGFNSTGAAKGWSAYAGTGKLRDFSGWYHVLIRAFPSSSGKSYDGVELEIYINGKETGTTIAGGSPSGGCRINDGQAKTIGYNAPDGNYFNGYIAEWHLVDGTAAAVTDFGEYDNNGVWRPIEYTGSYGTQGYYLKFDPSATNGVGHDHSGNGNNFTPTGFTTSGTGTDVISDTPTTNWCTLNPLDAGTAGMLSDGNLTYNLGSGSNFTVRATHGMSSGKWYAEWTFNAGTNSDIGIASYKAGLGLYLGQDQYGYMYYNATGEKYNNSTGVSYGATYTTGDIIGIAFDADAGSLTFYKNGTSQGEAYTGLSDFPYFFAVGSNNTNGTFNFGQRAFAYTPPTGFKALNTSNLTAPTIKDGSQYFNTVLYTGNGSYPRAVTGAGFSPDWVWLKSRSDGYGHGTYDRVRGVGTSATSLRLDTTGQEGSPEIAPYIDMDSLDSDGFTLGNTVSSAELFNLSTKAYAAWCWKADNTSGSSNTAGSITSTVSANPSAGFSIATYTGNGTAGATIGHGLGVAPKMIIVKQRSGATDWQIGHQSIGWTKTLYFTTAAATTETGAWNNTAPTSTVFSVGTSRANTSSATYVAYCFAEVEGYSKFGSYVGNGDGGGDGTFVYLGFRPAFFMIKGPGGFDWYLFDNQRPGYNEKTYRLFPNLASPENVDQVGCDFVSNGVKLRSGNANVSSTVYYYAAFAEHPFGGANVSPATAR